MSDKLKKTFYAKKNTVCPVCSSEFKKEDLLTGRGRLIAGELTNELRRLYEPSKKFGDIHPLIYPVITCPNCYYSALTQDFDIENSEIINSLKAEETKRKIYFNKIFPTLNFNAPRTLKEGVASYVLAGMCYDSFPELASPIFKQGLCFLRAAWLTNELHKNFPQDNYDYLASIFYRKATFFYTYALEAEQNQIQGIPNNISLGPDIDNNFGYDGLLYLAAYLEFSYGAKANPEARIKLLENAKKTLSRIFGDGKSSKDKPAAILDKAKDVFSLIKKELKAAGGVNAKS